MAQHRAATTQTPRRPNGAGGEEEVVGPESRAPNPGCGGLQRPPIASYPAQRKPLVKISPWRQRPRSPLNPPNPVSGDWLPTPEIARNRANSRVSQESKFEPGLGG